MTPDQNAAKTTSGSSGLFADAIEYMIDAAQRTILMADVMRRRGNQYQEHLAQSVPHVLDYAVELVCDGRMLASPVNYALARIVPPKNVRISSATRPFIIVDPRAGHGPGIGGFKADSEIGVALNAGHPCYFVGFLPEPVPGQTIGDIALAEATFLEKVIARHPNADGKPCVVGNCQAGWAIMILAALRPELFGPIILAGSPLSYWAGVRGKNPMRYSGGLLGGSWLTALASDLGGGKFDGANLVQNFENMNPANTFWSKQYDVYEKVDTEAARYLEFERWWGGHVTLNAQEIQFIVDELFVGNKLASGQVETSDGSAIDLRNIRSPIVVFCSKGDNITPPPQALGWILDLYDDVDEIRSYGQTIVYTVHETVGHLGIFVSGSVARKEHSEFSSNIDLIDVLPPGLYEATFERKSPDIANAELIGGDWVMRCEQRTLDDIRAMGGNSPEDERRFATAARVSEINLALYRTFLQPVVKSFVPEDAGRALREWHPLRLQYAMWSDANPFMRQMGAMASAVALNRAPAASDNAFTAVQKNASQQIVGTLAAWGDAHDRFSEALFLAVYGSPLLQAAVGVDSKSTKPLRKAQKSALHREFVEARLAELKSRIAQGGLTESVLRGLLYVGLARGRVDERGAEALRRIRLTDEDKRLTLQQFKAIAREQFFLVLLYPEETLAAIPDLLPEEDEQRGRAFGALLKVLTTSGELTGEAASRLRKVEQLFKTKGQMGSSNIDTASLARAS